MGALDRRRRRPRGAQHLLGRVPARRRVQPPAPVRAGQDGRRHHPGPRRQPHRPGQRPPRAQPQRAHVGDRHPAPHRRAGGPLDRRAGDLGVRGHGDHRRLRAATRSTRSSRSPACSTGPTRPCRPSSATRTASTRSPAPCPPSRSRTSSPCATSSPCCSAPRWCGASPRRSSGYIVELGADGRLVRLQLEELMGGVEDDRRLVIQDYFHEDADWHLDEALEALADLDHRRAARPQDRRPRSLHLPDEQPTSTRRCSPGATGCCPRSPGCPSRSSSASSTASATCRRSCGPPSTTSTTSRASARPGPGPSRRACPAWPRPASSTATPDRSTTR